MLIIGKRVNNSSEEATPANKIQYEKSSKPPPSACLRSHVHKILKGVATKLYPILDLERA
jgi:hypothetical protein